MENKEVTHSKQGKEWSWRSPCMPNKSLLIKLQNHQKIFDNKKYCESDVCAENHHEKSLITKSGLFSLSVSYKKHFYDFE